MAMVLTAVAPLLAAAVLFVQNRALLSKTEVIHTAVNSNLSRVKDDLDIANKNIQDLQELVKRLLEERVDEKKR